MNHNILNSSEQVANDLEAAIILQEMSSSIEKEPVHVTDVSTCSQRQVKNNTKCALCNLPFKVPAAMPSTDRHTHRSQVLHHHYDDGKPHHRFHVQSLTNNQMFKVVDDNHSRIISPTSPLTSPSALYQTKIKQVRNDSQEGGKSDSRLIFPRRVVPSVFSDAPITPVLQSDAEISRSIRCTSSTLASATAKATTSPVCMKNINSIPSIPIIHYMDDEMIKNAKPLGPPPTLQKFRNFKSDYLKKISKSSLQHSSQYIQLQNLDCKVHQGGMSYNMNKNHNLQKTTKTDFGSLHLERSHAVNKGPNFTDTKALLLDQSKAFIKHQSSATNSNKNNTILCSFTTDESSFLSSNKKRIISKSFDTYPPVSPVSSTSRAKLKKSKICRMDNCETPSDKRSPYCTIHRGQRKCEHDGCTKYAQSKTRFCIGHGGGRRCQFPNCNKSARDQLFCASHGGGKRCSIPDCQKLSVGKQNIYCTAHGGGRRCQSKGCPKSAQSNSNFCVKHGGGRKCSIIGCVKVARGKLGLCLAHSLDCKQK